MESARQPNTTPITGQNSCAVLVSGGLDSAILLAEMLSKYEAVHPLYVRSGLAWEEAELRNLHLYLAALSGGHSLPALQVLDLPVADLYDKHWSLTGADVPDAASPDEAVFLPGRNLLLLGKALIWCHLQAIPILALGILKANPFPDASPAFFASYEEVVNRAMGGKVRIERPYAHLAKAEVLRRGQGLPLLLTFSCLRPEAERRHCGGCNKCAERRRAFAAAGIADPTDYATEESCTR
jgi:7-cyano-7-deazaguanine synthase